MERLTEEKQIGPFGSLKDKAESVPGAFGTYDCFYAHMVAVTRLKQYEDTGLEPEQVIQTKLALEGKLLAEIKEFDGIPADRVIELLQAERDGRLVALPDVKYTDADGEKALRRAMWTCGNTNNPVTRYAADAIAEKLCREAKEENPPLTLEELLELDGDPVWLSGDELNRYDIFHGERSPGWADFYCGRLSLFCYGKDWLAYRRKPEEGTGHGA